MPSYVCYRGVVNAQGWERLHLFVGCFGHRLVAAMVISLGRAMAMERMSGHLPRVPFPLTHLTRVLGSAHSALASHNGESAVAGAPMGGSAGIERPRWLVDLGVVAADARHLFGLLDADGDGLVTHRELRSVWDRLRDEETGSLKSESMAKLRRNLSRCRTALRDRIDERSGQPLSKDFSAGELLRVLTEVGVPAQSAWDLFTLVAAQECHMSPSCARRKV